MNKQTKSVNTLTIKKVTKFCILLAIMLLINTTTTIAQQSDCKTIDFASLATNVIDFNYSDKLSENPKGMILKVDKLKTHKKTIFLTFDACGQGGLSDGYDSLLVDFLIKEDIPVAFFISKKWALKNPQELDYIYTKGSKIDIYNHGNNHIPLSMNGESAYGIKGTNSFKEIYEEVELSALFFCKKIGYKPLLFRPGTAYADEQAVQFVNNLGYKVIGYSVLGDAGATFTKDRIKNNILNAQNGDIILLHFNHPESEVFEGVKIAINKIKLDNKVIFGRLSDYFN